MSNLQKENKKINKKKEACSSWLLPLNSFWIGMGSVLNIMGGYFDYNYSKSESEADAKAIYSDWYNIGNDLRNATATFKKAL